MLLFPGSGPGVSLVCRSLGGHSERPGDLRKAGLFLAEVCPSLSWGEVVWVKYWHSGFWGGVRQETLYKLQRGKEKEAHRVL